MPFGWGYDWLDWSPRKPKQAPRNGPTKRTRKGRVRR